jgi:hypothetical protein
MTPEPLWLLADQLGPHVHSTDAHRERKVVLVESTRVLRRKRFHRQKLHLVLSGMRHLAAELGDRATYLRTETYREALERVGRPVVVHEPTSHAALRFVERLHKEGLAAEILPTPTFALPRAEFEEWAGDRTTFRMEDFYRAGPTSTGYPTTAAAVRSTRASGSGTTRDPSLRATGRGCSGTASCWRRTTGRSGRWRRCSGSATWRRCWSRSRRGRCSDAALVRRAPPWRRRSHTPSTPSRPVRVVAGRVGLSQVLGGL